MASGGVERYVLTDERFNEEAYYDPLNWEKDYFDSIVSNDVEYFKNWGIKVDMPCKCKKDLGIMFHKDNYNNDIIYCVKHEIGIMRRYFENIVSEIRVPNHMHIEEN